VLSRLNCEQMRNLFGLVSWMAPTSVCMGVTARREFESMKYANYAGVAQAGMLATRLAEQGYVGDQECLDREPGFMRAQGSLKTDFELLVAELGQKWWILETALKYYPSCRYTHGPIDMLRKLMREQRLQAADIERIEIHMNPMAYAHSAVSRPGEEHQVGPPRTAERRVQHSLCDGVGSSGQATGTGLVCEGEHRRPGGVDAGFTDPYHRRRGGEGRGRAGVPRNAHPALPQGHAAPSPSGPADNATTAPRSIAMGTPGPRRRARHGSGSRPNSRIFAATFCRHGQSRKSSIRSGTWKRLRTSRRN